MSVLEIAKISSKSFIVNDGLINITKNTIETFSKFYSSYSTETNDRNKQEAENRSILDSAINLAVEQLNSQIATDCDIDFSHKISELKAIKASVSSLRGIEYFVAEFNKKVIDIKEFHYEETIGKKLREEKYKKIILETKELIAKYESIKNIEEIKNELEKLEKMIKESSSKSKTEILLKSLNDKKGSIKRQLKTYSETLVKLKEEREKLQDLMNTEEEKGIMATFAEDFKRIKVEIDKFDKANTIAMKTSSINEGKNLFKVFYAEHNIGKSINLDNLVESKIVIKKKNDKKIQWIEEIEEYSSQLEFFNKEELLKIKHLIDEIKTPEVYEERVKLIRDNVKLKLHEVKEKYKKTLLYKNIIKSQIELLGSDDKKPFVYLLDKQNITEAEFINIRHDIEKLISSRDNVLDVNLKKTVANNLTEKLQKMGYKVDTEDTDFDSVVGKLIDNEEVFFDTEYNEYKIRVKINENNQLITGVLRFVDEDNLESSSYSEQKEKELVSTWCGNYDKLLSYFSEIGIDLNVNLRKEHHEVDIIRVNTNKSSSKYSNKEKIIKQELKK